MTGYEAEDGRYLLRMGGMDALPEERRKRFKEAARDDAIIEVGGRAGSPSTHLADDKLLRSLSDMSELDKLPCLTRIVASRADEALLQPRLSAAGVRVDSAKLFGVGGRIRTSRSILWTRSSSGPLPSPSSPLAVRRMGIFSCPGGYFEISTNPSPNTSRTS
ncbi:hypothetical protein J27TS7_45100 [Paenibacillus dendritiformis]|nr:hypothetical protein J27TS7_45100 [Paenibacillus dendritiformis]